MTPEEVKQLQNGDEITWNDPDDGTCSKTGRILSAKLVGDTVCVVWEDGGYTECFPEELG